jgi:hypothetical protein
LDFTEILSNELWVGAAPTLTDLEEIKKRAGGKAVVMDLTRNPREEEWSKELGYSTRTGPPRLKRLFPRFQ